MFPDYRVLRTRIQVEQFDWLQEEAARQTETSGEQVTVSDIVRRLIQEAQQSQLTDMGRWS